MQILSALFVENFQLRQAPGPSTRIDITGAMFSLAAPGPLPVSIDPHLVALIHCPPDEAGTGVFEVVFRKGPSEDGEQVNKWIEPFKVEPGRFTYRLTKAALEFTEFGTLYAHCRVDRGPWTIVPLTLLPPV